MLRVGLRVGLRVKYQYRYRYYRGDCKGGQKKPRRSSNSVRALCRLDGGQPISKRNELSQTTRTLYQTSSQFVKSNNLCKSSKSRTCSYQSNSPQSFKALPLHFQFPCSAWLASYRTHLPRSPAIQPCDHQWYSHRSAA